MWPLPHTCLPVRHGLDTRLMFTYTISVASTRVHENHNSLGRERPLGLDVTQACTFVGSYWGVNGQGCTCRSCTECMIELLARIHVIIMIVVHYVAEDIQSDVVLTCGGNSLCITLHLCFHTCVICPSVMLLL